MPLTIHGNMSGKNGIPTDKLSLPSLFSGETRLCPDKSPMLRRADAQTRQCSSTAARTGHCLTKALCSLYRQDDTRAVADNTLVQSELKVLPVPICGQVKPSSACLSAPCLPPPKDHEMPDDIVVADAGERAYTSESQKGWAAEIENMVRKGGDADSGMIEISVRRLQQPSFP